MAAFCAANTPSVAPCTTSLLARERTALVGGRRWWGAFCRFQVQTLLVRAHPPSHQHILPSRRQTRRSTAFGSYVVLTDPRASRQPLSVHAAFFSYFGWGSGDIKTMPVVKDAFERQETPLAETVSLKLRQQWPTF